VPGRIVLSGAAGCIGGRPAQAMAASGVRPALAGRDQGRLNALAERLSRDHGGVTLETAVAGSERPRPLRELLGAGAVFVPAAGPFLEVGRPVVEAAVDAGAIYLDSSGQPPPVLAWAAGTAAARGVWPAGALGPAEAFGLASPGQTCAEAGFHRQPDRKDAR